MTLRRFVRFTAVGRLLMIPMRFVLFGVPRLLRVLRQVLRWTFLSKEYYNWTYHLTDLNKAFLASFISVISGHEVSVIEGYIRELDNDQALRSLLIERTHASPDRHSCDAEPRYGRRAGWYALVRATKPRVIVETGVDRGLGTAVLAAALLQNAKEGQPGVVYATDIVPDCGHLVAEPYRQYCRLLIGDSVQLLKQFDQPVDIFLHDSDHRPEYEWSELTTIEPRLHKASLVLSDNSPQTTPDVSKLREFAQRLGRSYLFFQEQPRDHWWAGEGIGVAFVPGVKTYFPALDKTAQPAKPAGAATRTG